MKEFFTYKPENLRNAVELLELAEHYEFFDIYQ